MSYLNTPRLTFSGQFIADPSTVNNDTTHFNNATFDPEYQTFAPNDNPQSNGWWNPSGTGNWRFVGCTIKTVTYSDGTSTSDPAVDPIIGMSVMDTDSRTAGKLVDLDPQQQMVSEIWGFIVRLTDSQGNTLVKGDYQVAAFTNIWFNRSVDLQADSGAGAVYQSVLQNVQWNISFIGSRYLNELMQASPNSLSINFNVDRYHGDHTKADFTLGRITGAIGPVLPNEPEHFVLGRQLTPLTLPFPYSNPPGSYNFATAIVTQNPAQVVLDFGNSIQFNTGGVVNPTDTFQLAIDMGSTAQPRYINLGIINYTAPDWYMDTAGICTFNLNNNYTLALSNPLVILNASQNNTPILEETPLYVRADKFVYRLNPGQNDGNTSFDINFYATNFGVLLGNTNPPATVNLSQSGLFNQNDNSGNPIPASLSIPVPNNSPYYGNLPPYNPDSPNTPPNIPPQPVNGIPVAALGVSASSQTPTTFPINNGLAVANIRFQDPNNAREFQYYAPNQANTAYVLTSYSPPQYMDGQYYNINYTVTSGTQTQANSNPSNFISILIFNGPPQSPPNPVTWSDIAPIMQQYANLYPLMSKGIFNIANQQVVDSNAQLLKTVFSKNVEDPNYMPATRDLSVYKKSLILAYLDSVIASQNP